MTLKFLRRRFVLRSKIEASANIADLLRAWSAAALSLIDARQSSSPAKPGVEKCASNVVVTLRGALLLILLAVPTANAAPLEIFQDCNECPEMIEIPMGKFVIGARSRETQHGWIPGDRTQKIYSGDQSWFMRTNEQPAHEVEVDIPFAMSRNEITYDEWMACVRDGGCGDYTPPDRLYRTSGPFIGGKHPVTRVSFEDAKNYTAWLNKKLQTDAYRLPTEAEWEYAAQAGSVTRFSQGDTINTQQANFSGKMTSFITFDDRPSGRVTRRSCENTHSMLTEPPTLGLDGEITITTTAEERPAYRRHNSRMCYTLPDGLAAITSGQPADDGRPDYCAILVACQSQAPASIKERDEAHAYPASRSIVSDYAAKSLARIYSAKINKPKSARRRRSASDPTDPEKLSHKRNTEFKNLQALRSDLQKRSESYADHDLREIKRLFHIGDFPEIVLLSGKLFRPDISLSQFPEENRAELIHIFMRSFYEVFKGDESVVEYFEH